MRNKKADLQQFFKTMWIMAKYDVLPWMVGIGLVTGFYVWCFDNQDKFSKGINFESVFKKQAAPIDSLRQNAR